MKSHHLGKETKSAFGYPTINHLAFRACNLNFVKLWSLITFWFFSLHIRIVYWSTVSYVILVGQKEEKGSKINGYVGWRVIWNGTKDRRRTVGKKWNNLKVRKDVCGRHVLPWLISNCNSNSHWGMGPPQWL